ncbi:hypothetical protein D7Y32_19010 [Stenotrophomonas maltophilia]|nr:hypothetical protein [Stenotrophomonas maltophilia]MBA0262017.1 hypothetical protein [Stenotrophomonas maltophilia]
MRLSVGVTFGWRRLAIRSRSMAGGAWGPSGPPVWHLPVFEPRTVRHLCLVALLSVLYGALP